MSWPGPRYLGEHGGTSAVSGSAGTEPEPASPRGDRIHHLATHALTGGGFGPYRAGPGPRAPGAGTHFHRTVPEPFLVLSGEVRLYDGEDWTTGRQGDLRYVPPGGPHAFRNDSDGPTSKPVLLTPGAPREECFEKAVEMARRRGVRGVPAAPRQPLHRSPGRAAGGVTAHRSGGPVLPASLRALSFSGCETSR